MLTIEQLARITAVCRVETLRFRSPDSCIASVRVLTDVLSYFGHSSEPLACTTVVFNAAGWEQLQQGIPHEQWSPEAHSVGVEGTGNLRSHDPNRWDGHLVALVDDGRWLVDPSLDQFARPQRDINVMPAVLDATDWADRSRMHYWGRPDGTVVGYQVMAHAGPWRQSPDWRGRKNEAAFRASVGAAIRTLKEEVAS